MSTTVGVNLTDIYSHNSFYRSGVKRKYPINKPTFEQLKPLEEYFKMDYERMKKLSRRTWALYGEGITRPHLKIQIEKFPGRERISHKGKKYCMYQYNVTITNDANQQSAQFGKMESLSSVIDNTIKLMTFQVVG